MTVSLSVIIATYNRHKLLRETLQDIAAQETRGFSFEVIVVDNASTDGTREMVQSLAADYPVKLHYLFESKQGKSFALNTGIRAAETAILVFTDDDTKIGPRWLAVIKEGFEKYQADGAGGPVRPHWISPKPEWLNPYIVRQLGIFDPGNEEKILTSELEMFIGPNCAYTRELFTRIGGYDEVRPTGGSQDIEFGRRAFNAGAKLVYLPQAEVFQKIDGQSITKKKIASRFLKQGQGCAYGLQEEGKGKRIFRIPIWVIRFYVQLHFSALLLWLKGEKEKALWDWLRRYFYLGAMYYCFLDWAHKKPMQHGRPEISQALPEGRS